MDGHPGAVPWRDRRLAAPAVVVLLVVAVLVILLVLPPGGIGGSGDGAAPEAGVGPAVATATIFADTVSGEGVDGRAAAIGRWVLPSRIPEFVRAFDQNAAADDAAGATRPAAARAYKVVEEGPGVAVVLVWTQPEDGGPDARGEISGYGVMEQGGRWWVFSYEGTLAGVSPGDAELDEFESVTVPAA